MKKINRITKSIIILLIAFMMLFATKVSAAELSTTEPIKVAGLGQIISAGNEFIDKGEKAQQNDTTVDSFAEQLAPIGSILAGVGIVIFMVVLAIMAIKWIVAKPDDKAKLKQAFIGYVVSAIVFFGAIGIWRLVIGIMGNVQNSIG